MDANTVTAVCAVVIAVASLVVSFTEHRINRAHHRYSIRPLLQIHRVKQYRDLEAGLKIVNYGLGPAIITGSLVRLDGTPLGEWDFSAYRKIRDIIESEGNDAKGLRTLALDKGRILEVGHESFLLGKYDFENDNHAWFWELVTKRIQLEVQYGSLYDKESFETALIEWYS